MNIVNKLTLRHIKTHKKRSVLTIMAIIVSVAMVTAVFTSGLSFVNYFKNVSQAIDGSWHAYVHIDNYFDNENEFKSDKIKKYGIDIEYGTATLESKTSVDGIDFEINAVNESYLDLRNIKISQGRMPKSTNEILVHKGYLEKNDISWKLGDKITFPIEYYENEQFTIRDTQFTIVGFTDSNVAETDSVNGFVYATDEYIKQASMISVYIEYANLSKDVYDDTNSIASKVNSQADCGYNTALLTYSGITTDDSTIKVMAGFCAIILVIIAIVSIFMIYDSFAVSYQERARYLGMLASVGATKRQKRNSIYFEGFILGLIGIPLGILAGVGGIWITFKAISDVWIETLAVEYKGALEVVVNWIVIVGTVIASAITIFISSYIPAVKASKTTAIDAIRQTNTVKVKKSKRLRTSKLATRLLGYEGALAIKNFKRNGKRSRTIVFSLIMSVVVFLSVANFSLMFNDVMKQSYIAYPDLTASVDFTEREKLDKAIAKTSGIDSYYGLSYEFAQLDSFYFVDKDNKDNRITLIFVDNNTLDMYLNQLGEATEKYHNINSPTGILHNSVLTKQGDTKKKATPLIDLQDKTLTSNVVINDSNESVEINAKVGIQTTQDYDEETFFFNYSTLPYMVLSIDMLEQLKQDYPVFTMYDTSITTNDSNAVEEELWKQLSAESFSGASIYSANSQMELINNILTIAKVFVYGFIALITLISIMNIINTISNSMNERRREFAMIRSVGMTPSSFNKMIYYESFRYGLKSLIIALPISVGIHYLMYRQLSGSYDYGFKLHPIVYAVAIIAVFLIIGVAIIYSTSKIKKDNIIETLKLDIN